ncbi:histidine--tRNA ligase [Alphaproteobacteria bacterium]|nr:histidine--tRNA ligase [Alphaproteobacteria bacterium]
MNKKKVSTVRGMHDVYGVSFYKQKTIIEIFTKVASTFNFTPMQTPIMEHSDIFLRTLGNASDVVMKEMYSFLDKSNDSLTLRPEGTAGIARALISNGLTQNLPQRYFYYGPMFRYERPQHGRLRQFNQVGVELFGKGSYFEDSEVIRLAHYFLKELKINQKLQLKINTIGKFNSRDYFIKELRSYFNYNKKSLSSDSLKRLDRSPLRILDSKAPEDRDLLKGAPIIYDFLKPDELENFENLKKILESVNINYVVDPYLVRGLDYYNDTTFEFTLEKNEKFAVLAGGRYGSLIEELGGDKISGVGWAAGIERLESLMLNNSLVSSPIILIPIEERFMNHILTISNKMYYNGIKNQILNHFNLKKSLKHANKINAKVAIIVGEEEFNNSQVSYKSLEDGSQIVLKETELFEKIKNE